MSEVSAITMLSIGLGIALGLGYLAYRIGLSPIVGYLCAGIVVGPFTPGFVTDSELSHQFAEIGVILMLFGIGLRFSLNELVAVWRVAVPGALIQSALSTAMLTFMLHFLGWDWGTGVVLGLAISVSSTVVMVRVLGDYHDLHTPIGHIAIGWTVVEDLLTVTILLLLPIIVASDGLSASQIIPALGIAGVKVIGLGLIMVVLGRWIIPWVLEHIERTQSREFFTLAVLVLALGIAVLSAQAFGMSMALGAFLAGLAVGRSEFASRAAGDALPMRDAFTALFFVSIGMLFDPKSLLTSPWLLTSVLAVVLIGKPLAAWLTVRLLGRPNRTAVPIAAVLAQVGEFSFILGIVARDLGVIGNDAWNALVAVAIISIAANPSIYRFGWFLATPAINPSPSAATDKRPVINPQHCILVGYGPVGRLIYGILVSRGIIVTVVELNLATVRHLKKEGIPAFYGDAQRSDTLEEVDLATASSLILSIDSDNTVDIVRHARAINSEVRILVRCSHLRNAAALRRAGADVIAAGEGEVAVALVEAVIDADITSAEAVAQQRLAIRNQLYGTIS